MVNEVKDVKELSVEEMKAKIQAVDEENIRKAKEEIEAVLEKYGVRMEGVAVIPANQIQIVPKR